MQIQGLGEVTRDERFEWYRSKPIAVPVIGGKKCRVVVEGYDKDPHKDHFHAAIANFLAVNPDVLKQAEPHIFRYYQDCAEHWDEDDRPVTIKNAANVWKHVRLGNKPMVTRRSGGDRKIYVSLECGCDWEEEHGLQIVFKNGQKVNKVGPYDGHLTNSDAYADRSLENVVYR